MLTIGSLVDSGLDESQFFFLSEGIAKKFSDYECATGDIVFSRVADVGRCHVISGDEVGHIISSNLIRIRTDAQLVLPDYLWLTLKHSVDLRKQIAGLTTQAAGRLLVNTKTLARLKFKLPNIDDQRTLIETYSEMIRRVRETQSRRKDLRLMQETIASDTLGGE